MPQHNTALWSRHGDTTDAANDYRARTTAPTASTDGVAVPPHMRDVLGHLMVTHEAAGARTATIELFGYKEASRIEISGAWVDIASSGQWAHLGSFNISGSANAAECHLLEAISGFTRLAAQVSASTGTPDIWTDFGFSPVGG